MIHDDKMKAVEKYKRERESCKNVDGTPWQTTHAEIMAFLNGWDAAIKFMELENEKEINAS